MKRSARQARQAFAGRILKYEAMPGNARKLPPVCLSIAILDLLSGKLRMSQEYRGSKIRFYDNQSFIIFRHIKKRKLTFSEDPVTFVVRFKFARLSHKANKLASIIPILLIAGSPGFVQKVYAVNNTNGYWQGMYEWKSEDHLEAFTKSFVYRMMNKRALMGTVQAHTFLNPGFSDLIETEISRNEYLL